MKILWYNKNINVLLNELKNHSISKKITKFILGGNTMIIDVELNEKKTKTVKRSFGI